MPINPSTQRTSIENMNDFVNDYLAPSKYQKRLIKKFTHSQRDQRDLYELIKIQNDDQPIKFQMLCCGKNAMKGYWIKIGTTRLLINMKPELSYPQRIEAALHLKWLSGETRRMIQYMNATPFVEYQPK
tara:strand:- start:404 stop:790 length:387 start_codon:yes stop_codon:yes gene_type:complete